MKFLRSTFLAAALYALACPTLAWAVAPYTMGNLQVPSTAATTQAFTTSAACNAGDVAIAWVDISLRLISSATDNSSGGPNTWTVGTPITSGSRLYPIYSALAHTIASGGTVTFTNTGIGANFTVAMDCFPSANTIQAGTGSSGTSTTQTFTTGALTNAGYVSGATRFNVGGAAATVTSPLILLTTSLQTNYGIKSYYGTTTTAGLTNVGTASVNTSYIIGWTAMKFVAATGGACTLNLIGVGSC